MGNFYNALGVSKEASQADLKKAYRKLVRDLHPDRHPGDKKAEELFKQIIRAYEVLSNARTRAQYDACGQAGLDRSTRRSGFRASGSDHAGSEQVYSASSFEELLRRHARRDSGFVGFDEMFYDDARNEHRQPQTIPECGQDIETRLEIDFLESVTGVQKHLVLLDAHTGQSREFKIKIPAGIVDKESIRFRGQGAANREGGSRGDLVVEVRVRFHPFLNRDGYDLHTDLPLTFVEALKGCSVDLPTPHGTVTLSIPPSSQSGAVLRIKGHGIRVSEKVKGDFLVHLQIRVPEKGLSEEKQQKIDELLRDSYDEESLRDSIRL